MIPFPAYALIDVNCEDVHRHVKKILHEVPRKRFCKVSCRRLGTRWRVSWTDYNLSQQFLGERREVAEASKNCNEITCVVSNQWRNPPTFSTETIPEWILLQHCYSCFTFRLLACSIILCLRTAFNIHEHDYELFFRSTFFLSLTLPYMVDVNV